MTSTLVVTVKSDKTQARLQQFYKPNENKDREAADALADYFKSLACGVERGQVDIQTGSAVPVRASGTFTLASVVADEAITIGTKTLTFKASPSGEDQVQSGGANDTADAVVLAAAINAHSVLSKVVKATPAAAVVTVEARVAGVVGNQIPISETGTTITASGTFLENGTGGAEDEEASYNLGLS